MSDRVNLFNPLGNEKYKAIVHQPDLNQILIDKVLPLKPRLREINIEVQNGELVLFGIAEPLPLNYEWLSPKSVFFRVRLQKQETLPDCVLFSIKEMKVSAPQIRFDYVRIYNFFSKKLKVLLMHEFCKPGSPFDMPVHLKQLRFNFEFIRKRIPENVRQLGHITVLNVSIESGRIVWFVESNLILKSLIDTWGPKYIKLEQFDPGQDTLRLLTDFPLKFFGS